MTRLRSWLLLELLAIASTPAACTCGGGTDAGGGTDGTPATDALPGADSAPATDSSPGADSAATDSGDAGGGGSAAMELCAGLAPGFCDAVFSCCDAGSRAFWGGSRTACEPMVVAACTSDSAGIDTRAADGRTSLDPTGLAACAAALTGLAADCDRFLVAVVTLDCYVGAFIGTVPAGGSCTMLGTDIPSVECLPGTICIEPTCIALGGAGAACDANAPCDWRIDLRCVDDGGGTTTCQPGLANGSPCIADEECLSWTCPAGVCESPSDVCAG